MPRQEPTGVDLMKAAAGRVGGLVPAFEETRHDVVDAADSCFHTATHISRHRARPPRGALLLPGRGAVKQDRCCSSRTAALGPQSQARETADERQHPAAAFSRLRKQAVGPRPLVFAAQQHAPILTCRRR